MAGRRVRCKDCGTTFQLPAPATNDDPFERPQDDDAGGVPVGSSGSVFDDDAGAGMAGDDDAPPPIKRRAPAAPPGDAPFGDSPFDPSSPDLDAAFDEAFQEYTPARGNTPFVFPGSRWLDRWLSTIIAGICVVWMSYLALSSVVKEPGWVGPIRLLILMLTYVGVVYPFCLKGVRMAARKLNYELPSGTPWRAFSTFLLPTTIGCALWLGSGSPPGFFLGAALGLVVALPVMWLLFRIRQDDAPTSLGYGAGAFGVGLLASTLILVALNLVMYGVIRATEADHSLNMSPFGPGFTWDPPKEPEKPKRKPAPLVKIGEPEKPTTKAFSDLVDPGTTQPAPPPPDQVVFNPTATSAPTDPATLKEIEERQAVAAQPDVAPTLVPSVGAIEHGPIVAEAKPRISLEMETLVQPLLPGKAVAVIKPAPRANEDSVEMWSTVDWQPKKGVSFARSAQAGEHYQLSSDGKLLARLTDFPQASAQVYSFEQEALVRPFIKLDPKGPVPTIVGFCAPDQLLMMFRAGNGSPAAIEVWNVSRIVRRRRIEVPGLRTDSRSHVLSRDGKLLAVIVHDPVAGGDQNGRIELYNLDTGALVRKIVIDELDWNAGAIPAGISMTDEAKRIAVLFEREGQGFFLCWAADNDIPVHQFIYPGGLLPPGVNVMGFRGPAFSLIDDGRAWILYGASVFDSASGRRLGDLGISDIRSQRVINRDTVMLLRRRPSDPNQTLLEVKLDVSKARRQELAKP